MGTYIKIIYYIMIILLSRSYTLRASLAVTGGNGKNYCAYRLPTKDERKYTAYNKIIIYNK